MQFTKFFISKQFRLRCVFLTESVLNVSPGGWSDTPPIAFEHGGLVVNVAIKVDGKRPIGARVRRVPEPHLLLVSTSGEPSCSFSTETLCEDLSDLEDYCQPHAPGQRSCVIRDCEVHTADTQYDANVLSVGFRSPAEGRVCVQ